MELVIPSAFRARVVAARREEGSRWLDSLPELVESLAERWDLRLGTPFEPSWSYVVPAERAVGEDCVLKLELLPPGGARDLVAEGPAREARALSLAGDSAVRLLDSDLDVGALLLERASGGPLSRQVPRDDDQATEILGNAMLSWWAPVGEESGLPPLGVLEETFEEFERGPHGPFVAAKADLVQSLADTASGYKELRAAAATARRVFEELLADRAPTVVVHGDLHHDNVLLDEERGWVVIDPKGFFGSAGFDTAAMLYNPMTAVPSDVEGRLRRRMDILSGVVRLDTNLLAAWGYVRAVVSLLHSLEDGGELDARDVRMQTIAALRKRI